MSQTVKIALYFFVKPVRRMYLIVLASLLLAASAQAAIDIYPFDSDVQRLRYQSFVEELRCPKCQNQNLAGSDSPISADLRRELHRLIMAGQSDKEVIDFMVSRYGEYVLYRPRAQGVTLILWLAPVLLLVLALVVVLSLFASKRRVITPLTQPLTKAAGGGDTERHGLSNVDLNDVDLSNVDLNNSDLSNTDSSRELKEGDLACEQVSPRALSDAQRATLDKLLNR